MNFEAVIFDTDRGHHRRGTGGSPVVACTNALRKIVVFEVDEVDAEKVQNIGTQDVLQCMCMVNVDDEDYFEPKTLKEDVHTSMILLRVDKTKENMYTPIGYVRPTI